MVRNRIPNATRVTMQRHAIAILPFCAAASGRIRTCAMAAALLGACAGLPTDFGDSEGRLPPSQRQHPAEHLRELPTALVQPVALRDGRISVPAPVDPGLSVQTVDDPRASVATLSVRDESIVLLAREAHARVATSLVAETTALMQPIADAVGAFRVDEPDTGCDDAVIFVPTGPVVTDDGLLLGTLFAAHPDGTVLTLQAVTRGIDPADLRFTSDLALDMLAGASCGGPPLALDGGARTLDGPGGPAIAITLPPEVAWSAGPAGEGVMHWFDAVGSVVDEPAVLMLYVGPEALRAPQLPTGSITALPDGGLDGAWIRTAGSDDEPARDDLYATLADGTPVHATASAWDTALLDALRTVLDGASDLRR